MATDKRIAARVIRTCDPRLPRHTAGGAGLGYNRLGGTLTTYVGVPSFRIEVR